LIPYNKTNTNSNTTKNNNTNILSLIFIKI